MAAGLSGPYEKSKVLNAREGRRLSPTLFLTHSRDKKIRKVEEECGTLVSYIDTIYSIENNTTAPSKKDRFFLLVPRHRLRTTKETIQPKNKAPMRTILVGSFDSFVMMAPAERPER